VNEKNKWLLSCAIVAVVFALLGAGGMFWYFSADSEALRGKINILSERNKRIESELVTSNEKLELTINRLKQYEEEISRLENVIREIGDGFIELANGIEGIEDRARINKEILNGCFDRIRKIQSGFDDDFQFLKQIRKEIQGN
jgi:predicted nuclease with TOPRIM domain